MLDTKTTSLPVRGRDDSCDIRVWSGACEHTTGVTSGDKFLCEICGTISGLNHEVHGASMPYVSGDYHSLS